MAISPQILLDQASCLECYSANGYSLQMLRLAIWAGQYPGSPQIVEYSGPSPSIDGVVPADPTLPAMAYSADGTGSTYVWDTATQTWDDGGPWHYLDYALVSYYKFDTDAATAVLDSVGSNNLTLVSGTVSFGGIINQYLSISGQNGMKITPLPVGFQCGSGVSFSASIWIKPTLGQGALPVIAGVNDAVSSNASWLLNMAGGKLQLSASCTNGSFGNLVGPSQPSNAWHHVAWGYDSINKILWIQLDAGARSTAGTTADIRAGNAPFWIGSDYANERFSGGIDEMAIWKNRVLTTAEVTSLFNGGAALPLSAYATTL